MSQPEPTPRQPLQVVSFHLGEHEFAVDIMRCMEIHRMLPITPLPSAPPFVEGVFTLRGTVIPCVDLRKRFEMPPVEPTGRSRIVIIELAGEGQQAGLLVDRVERRVALDPDSITEPPALTTNVEPRYLSGVCQVDEHLLLILDIDYIFSPGELARLAALET